MIIEIEAKERGSDERRGTGGVITEKVFPTSGHRCSHESPCNIPVQWFSEDTAIQTATQLLSQLMGCRMWRVAGPDWCLVPSKQQAATAAEPSSLLTQTLGYMQHDSRGTGASAARAATSLPSTLN